MCRKFQHFIFFLRCRRRCRCRCCCCYSKYVHSETQLNGLRARAHVCANTRFAEQSKAVPLSGTHTPTLVCASVSLSLTKCTAIAADAKRDGSRDVCVLGMRQMQNGYTRNLILTFCVQMRPISRIRTRFQQKSIYYSFSWQFQSTLQRTEHATRTFAPSPPQLKCLHSLFLNYVLDRSIIAKNRKY